MKDFEMESHYDFMTEIIRSLIKDYNDKRESQIKEAVIKAGFIFDDWYQFLKSRCTIVQDGDFNNDFYVDGRLVCTWSDKVNFDTDFNRADFTTTFKLSVG